MNNITFSQIGQGVTSGLAYAGTQLTSSPLSAFCFTAKVAGGALGVYTIYSLFESAIADILCLKTFRHGTNPYAHLRINWEGPKYERAGKGGEADYWKARHGTSSPFANRDASNGGYFYVVEDWMSDDSLKSRFDFVESYISTKLTAKYYSLRSTIGFACSLIPLPRCVTKAVSGCAIELFENGVKHGEGGFYLRAIGLMTPTVKFHVKPDTVKISPPVTPVVFFADPTRDYLENDKLLFARDGSDSGKGGNFEGALVTQYRFSVLDIGFMGILKNGVNSSLFNRIREHKGQCLWGVAQLVYAIAFTALTVGIIAPTMVPYGAAITFVAMNFSEMSPGLQKLACYLSGIPLLILGSYTLFQI